MPSTQPLPLLQEEPSGFRSTEALLRESEERYRATFEQAALGILHIGMDGRILAVNRRLCELHGYARGELLGMQASSLTVGGPAASKAEIEDLLAGRCRSYTAERRFIRKGGEVYHARVLVTLVRNAPAPYFISIVEDLTHQRAAQRRIRQQAQMLDQASDAIVVHEMDRTIRYWNEGAERLFGWSAAQAVGRSFADLMGQEASIPDAERNQLLHGGHWHAQVRCRTADGRLVDVERRLTVVHGEDDEPPVVLSVNTDVTQRVRAEHEVRRLNLELEDRIRQRTAELESSNEELRTLAYALAHDLRAPLGSLDGFGRQLERHLDGLLDDKGRHYLARVRAATQQMAELTEALLRLARLSQAGLFREAVDLSALADAWRQRMAEQEPQRRVRVRIAPTPPAWGDRALLADVLENLLGNAWKFSARREDATIAFGAEPGDDGTPVYAVRDDGAGFDPDYAKRLFTPFQRLHTASEFEGTGMGLAIVRKIILRHGGRIWAEGRPGEGATFRFSLPAADGPAAIE